MYHGQYIRPPLILPVDGVTMCRAPDRHVNKMGEEKGTQARSPTVLG